MKQVNLIFLLFCGALLLFTFQNCQKAPLENDAVDSNSVLTIGLPQYKYKKVSLQAQAGYVVCSGSCPVASQVDLDLEQGTLKISAQRSGEKTTASTSEFTFNLKNSSVQKIHAALSLLKITEHQAVNCNDRPCPILADAQTIVHTYTDFNDLNLNVYYPSAVDLNLRNTNYGKYDLSIDPSSFLCRIKLEILAATEFSTEEKTAALEALAQTALTGLNHESCP